MAFSPDGKKLVSGSSDKTIKLWNVDNAAVIRTLHGHDSIVASVASDVQFGSVLVQIVKLPLAQLAGNERSRALGQRPRNSLESGFVVLRRTPKPAARAVGSVYASAL